MKISNKRELQQIACNHPSHIDFEDFMNLYKNSYYKNSDMVKQELRVTSYELKA